MASLIIFLCFSFFMFAAGYQWRKLEESRGKHPVPGGPVLPQHTVWDGMVGKL